MSKHVILLLGAVFLLMPHPAAAQMVVDGPSTPTAHSLTAWFQKYVPAKFQAHNKFEVQPFSDAGMKAYLHDGNSDPGGSEKQFRRRRRH